MLQTTGPKHARLWLLGTVLVTLGVYAKSFWNGYTYDDRTFVQAPTGTEPPQENHMVQRLHSPVDYWTSFYGEGVGKFGRGLRPMTVLSFALVYRLFRYESPAPGGYECPAAPQHVVNVLLHCICVVLCYLLVAQFLGEGIPALVAAAAFGLHALRSDPVISLVGRAEILAFLFGAGALLAYVGALRCRGGRRWAALLGVAVLLFLAFSCKESALPWAVLLPLWVVALRWHDEGHRSVLPDVRGQLVPIAAGILVPAVLFLLLLFRLWAQLADDPTHMEFVPAAEANPLYRMDFLERFPAAVTILGYALYKVLLPLSLACDYGAAVFDPAGFLDLRFLAAALVLAGVLCGGVLGARSQPLVLLAVAVFFGFAFLVSNIPVPIETIYGERLYYTPAFGLSLFLAWVASRLPAGKPWTRAAVVWFGLWLLFCAGKIVERTFDWESNQTLFRADVSSQPRSISMRMSVARFERDSGPGRDAAWKQQIDAALVLDDSSPQVLQEMARYHLRHGRFEDAREQLRRSLPEGGNQHPDVGDFDEDGMSLMGRSYMIEGRVGEAIAWFRKAVAAEEQDAEYRLDLGRALYEHGDRKEAWTVLRGVVERWPQCGPAWEILLGFAHREGNLDTVQGLIREAETKMPNSAMLNVQRGMLAMRLDRPHDAVRWFDQGLPYLPGSERLPRARQWLQFAIALARIGQAEPAARIARDFLQAPDLAPGLAPPERAGFEQLLRQLGGR